MSVYMKHAIGKFDSIPWLAREGVRVLSGTQSYYKNFFSQVFYSHTMGCSGIVVDNL